MKELFIERVKLCAKCDEVDMDMSFKKDLLLDSLTFTKLIVDLEEAFNLEFDDDAYIVDEDVKVADLYNVLMAKMGVA